MKRLIILVAILLFLATWVKAGEIVLSSSDNEYQLIRQEREWHKLTLSYKGKPVYEIVPVHYVDVEKQYMWTKPIYDELADRSLHKEIKPFDDITGDGISNLVIIEYPSPGQISSFVVRVLSLNKGLITEYKAFEGGGEVYYFADFDKDGVLEFVNTDGERKFVYNKDGMPLSDNVWVFDPKQKEYIRTSSLIPGLSTESSSNTSKITETKVIHYVPPVPLPKDIEIRLGDCWRTSLMAPRKDAWRCMVGDEIFDPCFSIEGGKYVVYQNDPPSGTPDFLIKLTEPLPKPELSPGKKNLAWMIELADGTIASLMGGATALVDGKRINYTISIQDDGGNISIIGDLKPGKVWMAEKVTLGGKKPGPNDDGWFVIKSEIVPLRTVWQ